MTSRRTFLSGAVAILAAPLAVEAQQAGRVPRIGWLGGPTRETAQPFVQPFLQGRGVRDFGYVESRNVVSAPDPATSGLVTSLSQ
jgi:hypothetical protein